MEWTGARYADKPTAEADAFLQFVESPAGQEIVRKTGFIPVKDL